MQRTFKTIAIAFAGAALLQACSSENLEIPQEELYARAFIKEFGVNAQANPFNVATRKVVKVVTATPTDVKISAIVSGREYLFADYSAVSGSTDITFDLPAGIDDVFVRANGRKIPAKVGETVDLRANIGRATAETYFCNNLISYYETDPKIFEFKDVEDIIKKLPEEQPNTTNEGINSDFYFSAKDGDFMTFYPLFWNTTSSHSLGVYWLDEDGQFHWVDFDQDGTPITGMMKNYSKDLYRTRSGRLLYSTNYDKSNPDAATWQRAVAQCSHPDGSDPNKKIETWNKNVVFKATGITMKFHGDVKFGFFLKVQGVMNPLDIDENGYVGTYSHVLFSQADRNHYYGRILKDGTGKYYVKDQIEDRIEGKSVNYYVKGTDTRLYEYATDKAFNGIVWSVSNYCGGGQWGSVAVDNFFKGLTNYSRASYTHLPEKDAAGNITRNRSYFAFEDWSNGPIDLNDLIFIMTDSSVKPLDRDGNPIDDTDTPDDPDPEPYEWIIAAEDLGNTYDWDFNDMVVGVSYVASNDASVANKIKVRPLAAGGTMPVYLMFDNPASGKTEKVGKELHSWLGASTLSPVNVGANGEEKSGEAVEIEWTGADDFSLAANIDNTSWLTGESGNMGGFWLLVDSENKYASETDFSSVKNDGDVQCVKPNLTAGDSYVPQMICVGTEWCWPQEEQPIHEVYSGFKPWLSDPATVGSKWYGNDMSADYTCDVDNIVSRPSLTPAAGN